jgi:hypothetical protein
MLLTLGVCDTRASTYARRYTPRYYCQRPSGNVFWRLQRLPLETLSLAFAAVVNAGRQRSVATPANKDTIIVAVE